jgi:hypothetical protein
LGSGIRDPRSGIRDGKKPGSGIRDKHPGSATLVFNQKYVLKILNFHAVLPNGKYLFCKIHFFICNKKNNGRYRIVQANEKLS